MKKETKNIVIGAVVGGIVGLGAVSLFCSKRCKKTRVSKALCHLGDILDKGSEKGDALLDHAEESIDKNESGISNAMEWVSAGLQIWNKLKKGA